MHIPEPQNLPISNLSPRNQEVSPCPKDSRRALGKASMYSPESFWTFWEATIPAPNQNGTPSNHLFIAVFTESLLRFQMSWRECVLPGFARCRSQLKLALPEDTPRKKTLVWLTPLNPDLYQTCTRTPNPTFKTSDSVVSQASQLS